MNSNEMTRWTHPLNEAFYVLHKSAMGLFDTVKFLARVVWIIFSVQYLQQLLSDYAPYLAAVALPLSIALLVFLHYFGNELLRYTAFNTLDDDENTINTPANYAILFLVYTGLLALDIKGTTSFFDESDKFSGLETLNEKEQKEATKNRLDIYNADLATLTNGYAFEIQSLQADSAKAVQKAAASVYIADDFDRKKQQRLIRNAAEKHRSIIGAKQSDLANEQRTLLNAKNTDIANITTKHNTKGTKITTLADENKSGASHKGWLISLLCLGITVFCTIQGVKLRIKAGQKPISRFTINDATGSPTEKLFDALQDVWQRFAHFCIDKIHTALAIKELEQLDGAYTLKSKRGEILAISQTPPPSTGGGNPQSPNPPTGGGGNGGGGGGSMPPPPSISAPPMAMVLPTIVKTEHFNSLTNADLKAKIILSKRLFTAKIWEDSLVDIDPVIEFHSDNTASINIQDLEKVENLARYYTRKEDTSTPEPTPQTHNPVAQPISTVAQSEVVKSVTELDDKLQTLRERILKNSESHFKRGDAVNKSVAKRIFDACDEAYIALKKGGDVTPTVLNRFKEAALDRLDLAAAYDCTYDSRTDLMALLSNKEVGEK